MKNLFGNLNAQKKLALVALMLGAVAVFAGDPYDSSRTTVNVKELSLIVENETDHVSVEELSDWIIKGKSDYRLIDLNKENIFNEYHIPTAENISITALEESGLLRNEKIILYSEGGIHSAQAWMLLKAKGYKSVYMLLGGLDEWKDKILFPSLPANSGKEDSIKFNKIAEVSRFFGGAPQETSAGTEISGTRQLPKLQSPSGTIPAPVTKKKKKEGC